MVLKKIEHVITDVVGLLPSPSNSLYRLVAADDITNCIVHTYLVVKIVEACTKVVAVFSWIIDLTDKDDIRICKLHLVRSPAPELDRHHLSHITAETVDTLTRPEKQNVSHLAPGIGNRVEVPHMTSIIVDAIIQLHGLIPVVHPWRIAETVVTRSLGRLFDIGLRLTMIKVEVRRKPLTRTIIEIVLWVETNLGIVIFTEILHTFRLADGMILTGHMIGHEVDNHLHASPMSTLHEPFELLHTLVHVRCQVRIYVIIVCDGIG